MKACEVARQKPRARIRIGAPFQSDLTDFIEPAFEEVLQTCPRHLRPRYYASRHSYVFPETLAHIKCVGLDRKPNGLRGNTLDFIGLDEAGYMARLDQLYTRVIVPLTTHRPDAKILIQSSAPEAFDHPFWDFVDRAKLSGAYGEFTIDENPLLTQNDVARIEREMGGRHTSDFQREYLCKRIVDSKKAVLPEFRAEDVVKESPIHTAHKFWHRYVSLDSGVRDQTAELFGYYDFARATAVIEDEDTLQGHEVTTGAIAKSVRGKELERGYDQVHLRVADNDNLILIQDLAADFDLSFLATSKDSLVAMVNKVRLWLGAKRIEIHPRCRRLILCCQAALWNNQRDKFERSKVHGHYDLVAALIYFIRNIDEHTNPVPATFGVTADHFRRPDRTDNSNVRKAFSTTIRR